MDCNGISELSLMQLILKVLKFSAPELKSLPLTFLNLAPLMTYQTLDLNLTKISCIRGSLEIPLQSLNPAPSEDL